MAEDLYEMNNNPIQMQNSTDVLKRSELLKQYANQPAEVRKRVTALRKLQIQTTNLDVEFHQKVCEIEREFESRYQTIFSKRADIVNGRYEPTIQECDYSDTGVSLEIAQALESFNVNSRNDNLNTNDSVKGIPNFWLTIFKYFPMLEPFVREHDEPVLKYLTDVRTYTKTEPTLSFVLEFHFSPNEYFSNRVLTKEYFLKCTPDPDDYLAFDGPEIYKCAGCKINWYKGKNFTQRTVKKKFTGGMNENSSTRSIGVKSFFNFFDPPKTPDENDPNFDDINDHLEKDFEVGHYLKERIIPRAVLYFTGESEEFSPNESSTENTESDLGSEGEEQTNEADSGDAS